MLRRSVFTRATWDQFTTTLDERIAGAAQRLIEDRALTPMDLAEGFNELSRFRTPGGDDPDYNRRGLSVAYLLHNQGMRTSSLAIALGSLVRIPPRSRILDIGSGLDASALAVELSSNAHDVTLVASEPSHEMRSAAEWIPITEHSVRRIRLPHTLQQILEQGPFADSHYDGVILSASLARGFASDWTDSESRSAGKVLSSMIAPGGFLLAAEPAGRRVLAQRLGKVLQLGGLQPEIVSSSAIAPRGVALSRRLSRTTNVLESVADGIIALRPHSEASSLMFLNRWTNKVSPVLSWSPSVQMYYVFATRTAVRTSA